MQERITITTANGFEPHSDLCRAFNIGMAMYNRELRTLATEYKALAHAVQATADQPSQQIYAQKLARVRDQLTTVRAEENAWIFACSLACPRCAVGLEPSIWPLPDISASPARSVRTNDTDDEKRPEPGLLSDFLRREMRRMREGKTAFCRQTEGVHTEELV